MCGIDVFDLAGLVIVRLDPPFVLHFVKFLESFSDSQWIAGHPSLREKIVAFLSTSRFPRHVIFILIVLGSRISSSHFHLFFFVPSLCNVCRDVNRCALLIF